jgi:hypothetical protein
MDIRRRALRDPLTAWEALTEEERERFRERVEREREFRAAHKRVIEKLDRRTT